MDIPLAPETLIRAYCNGIFPMAEGKDTDKISENKNGVFDRGEFFIDIGNGIWDSLIATIPNAGGPYTSYIYQSERRTLLFIGLVNIPEKDKMVYVKQMETVFKNVK